MVSVDIEFTVETYMFKLYALTSMYFLLDSLWCITKGSILYAWLIMGEHVLG